MKTEDILGRLCYYDKRNPDYDAEIIESKATNKTCFCDNCFNGRTKMAEHILFLYDEISSLKKAIEDNADKKYTKEDMEKCWYNAMDIAHGTDDFPMGGNKFKYPTCKEFINSLNKQD